MQNRSALQEDSNLYSRVLYHPSYIPPPTSESTHDVFYTNLHSTCSSQSILRCGAFWVRGENDKLNAHVLNCVECHFQDTQQLNAVQSSATFGTSHKHLQGSRWNAALIYVHCVSCYGLCFLRVCCCCCSVQLYRLSTSMATTRLSGRMSPRFGLVGWWVLYVVSAA